MHDDYHPALHCIPIGGEEPVHWALEHCWCHPLLCETDELGGYQMFRHNARDCRERFERQGVWQAGHSWITTGGTGTLKEHGQKISQGTTVCER
jgi:hypothetical protein